LWLDSPRWRGFAKRVAGRKIIAVGRRAKYLTVDLDDGAVLVMHLGMSGSFRIEAKGASKNTATSYHAVAKLSAHDHVVFHMSGVGKKPGVTIVFNDPRRFGYMKIIARKALDEEPLLKGLGPEPLERVRFSAAVTMPSRTTSTASQYRYLPTEFASPRMPRATSRAGKSLKPPFAMRSLASLCPSETLLWRPSIPSSRSTFRLPGGPSQRASLHACGAPSNRHGSSRSRGRGNSSFS